MLATNCEGNWPRKGAKDARISTLLRFLCLFAAINLFSIRPTPQSVGLIFRRPPFLDQVLLELNTDFSTKGMAAPDIQAIVAAWQAGAISRGTMTDLFRAGEVLPEGRTNEEEVKLVGAQRDASASS